VADPEAIYVTSGYVASASELVPSSVRYQGLEKRAGRNKREREMTDPIADLLTRIRNAIMAGHSSVILPSSEIKLSIVKILKDQRFIRDYDLARDQNGRRRIRLQLSYDQQRNSTITNLKRISKPGLRIYVKKKDIPRPMGGLGMTILSTSQGLMTGRQAWQSGLGGELLCQVW